jgi:carbonic anhydrase
MRSQPGGSQPCPSPTSSSPTTPPTPRRSPAFTAAGDLPMPPARKVAVVACMDARLHVYGILGLREGDVHVIRNAGGVVTDDVIRSLLISQRLLGTEEIILIHHTDCGMLTFTDDELKRAVERETGLRPPFALESFSDVEQDVRQSLARIKASRSCPGASRCAASSTTSPLACCVRWPERRRSWRGPGAAGSSGRVVTAAAAASHGQLEGPMRVDVDPTRPTPRAPSHGADHGLWSRAEGPWRVSRRDHAAAGPPGPRPPADTRSRWACGSPGRRGTRNSGWSARSRSSAWSKGYVTPGPARRPAPAPRAPRPA